MNKRVLIASLLKPVNDVRAFHKIAKTIAACSDTEVFVMGRKPNEPLEETQIRMLPLSASNRNWKNRLKCIWEYTYTLWKVRPHVIIVNSPDYLIVSSLYRIIFGGTFCYDIRENYWRNFLLLNVYTPPFSWLLAVVTRATEYLCSPFVSHFLLAERTYETELHFIGSRYTIIENTYKPSGYIDMAKAAKQREEKTTRMDCFRNGSKLLRLVYTGTFAEVYGTLDAIVFAIKLKEQIPALRLKLTGYAAQQAFRQKIIEMVEQHDWIELETGDKPLPHFCIEEAIAWGDFGLLPYRVNDNNRNRIPTKMYEYAACRLPMLMSHNPVWDKLLKDWNAGLSIKFSSNSNFSISNITSIFYTNTNLANTLWISNTKKLTSLWQKWSKAMI